jgi:hypothetical protein
MLLEKYETILDAWLADIMAQENDDWVFAAGYLQGHIAVALAGIEAEYGQADFAPAALSNNMQAAFAIAEQELSAPDRVLIQQAWHHFMDFLTLQLASSETTEATIR